MSKYWNIKRILDETSERNDKGYHEGVWGGVLEYEMSIGQSISPSNIKKNIYTYT